MYPQKQSFIDVVMFFGDQYKAIIRHAREGPFHEKTNCITHNGIGNISDVESDYSNQCVAARSCPVVKTEHITAVIALYKTNRNVHVLPDGKLIP